MPTPSEVQYKQVERILDNLALSIPVHVRHLDDGAIQIDAGNPYVVSDADKMDSFLNELMDVDETLEPDELFDEVLGILDPYCDY